MRRLVLTQNMTLDGSIEMLGDWFNPQGQADQSDLIEELHRQDAQSDAFLTGRQTFEDLRATGLSRPRIRPESPTTSTTQPSTSSHRLSLILSGCTPPCYPVIQCHTFRR